MINTTLLSKLKFFWSGKLKILVFNVQDLFLFLDKYAGEDLSQLTEDQWRSFGSGLTPNKSLEKLIGLKKVFDEIKPDLAILVEVGGRESLHNFNRYFLNSYYQCFSQGSNSGRGIDVVMMAAPHLSAQFYSYKKIPHLKNQYFSRDIPVLKIFRKKKHCLTLMGVHLKSRLNLDGKDHGGMNKRKNELEGLLRLYQKETREAPQVPILIGGDFNGLAHTDYREHEFNELFGKTNLIDFLEALEVELNERYTHIFFKKSGKAIRSQLDYVLMDKKFLSLLNPSQCFVYRYKNEYGDRLQIDRLSEKFDLPSDHFPLVLEMNVAT